MGKYYYRKSKDNKIRKYLHPISILCIIIGISIVAYVLLPIISWQIYFQPFFSSQNIVLSIPRANIADLARNLIDRTDYAKAENWFPEFNPSVNSDQIQTHSYAISIPSIKIQNAEVSTADTDLTKHLVNYPGTGIPGKNGNAVIFGHSTLPQLFNSKDYKTIFANAYKLKNGDNIYVLINGVTYTYKISKTVVVDSSDTSALVQDYDNSYITLVTCTPPGTIWKRLIIKAQLQTI